MPVTVVDASAVAAILFGEASADAIVDRLGSNRLVAPSLLPYEIVSLAHGKLRRGEVSAEVAAMALGAFGRMRIALHEPHVLGLFRLTDRTRLTAYDAADIWLAQSLSADLVTLDERLAKVWSRHRT